jgi:hypothetical protein
MKKKTSEPFKSGDKKGKIKKEHSVVRGRDHVLDEEENDNYFGNNDPANVANEYEHNSVLESEAGVGYVDSAYRRRKIHDWKDHNASFELEPELHSDLDSEENYSSRFDPSADFDNHEEEARGERRNTNAEKSERDSRPGNDRTSIEADQELEHEDARGFHENRKRVSRRGVVHEKTDRNRERGGSSRDRRRRH